MDANPAPDQTQDPDAPLVGLLGSVSSIRAVTGASEWEKWLKHLGSSGLTRALHPLFAVGSNNDPRKRLGATPSITEDELQHQGIGIWINRINKYANNTDASPEAHFNLLDQGIGLPESFDAQLHDLKRRFSVFFETKTLPLKNPARAKLEIMRGLLLREFGRAVTEETVLETIQKMTLRPLSVASLLPSFLTMKLTVESMGQSECDNQRLLMKLFTRWLRTKYPACLQAVSAEYARYLQLKGESLTDILNNNVLDEPNYTYYVEVLRLLVKCTLQYDTSLTIASVATDPPWQEFSTVSAMTGGVSTDTSPGQQQQHQQQQHRHYQQQQFTPQRNKYGPSDSSNQSYRRTGPRDQQLPDISAFVPAKGGLICEACGLGGHYIKECQWITRVNLPKVSAHLASFMQAYRRGEDYFTKACTHLRQHGFMSKWTEQDCTEFVQEVRERINRRDQDPRARRTSNPENIATETTRPPPTWHAMSTTNPLGRRTRGWGTTERAIDGQAALRRESRRHNQRTSKYTRLPSRPPHQPPSYPLHPHPHESLSWRISQRHPAIHHNLPPPSLPTARPAQPTPRLNTHQPQHQPKTSRIQCQRNHVRVPRASASATAHPTSFETTQTRTPLQKTKRRLTTSPKSSKRTRNKTSRPWTPKRPPSRDRIPHQHPRNHSYFSRSEENKSRTPEDPQGLEEE